MIIQLDLTPKEIDLLRQGMDALPLRPYAPIICKVLIALPIFDSPESVAATIPGADSTSAAPNVPGLAGGFSLTAHTDKGRERLPGIQHLIDGLVAPWKLS